MPSFATDYSGFISVMHGLGGMMIVHDPSGCLGNYTNTDEPRWYHDPQPVFSSRMRELEAVIGDTDIIIEKQSKKYVGASHRLFAYSGLPFLRLLVVMLFLLQMKLKQKQMSAALELRQMVLGSMMTESKKL